MKFLIYLVCSLLSLSALAANSFDKDCSVTVVDQNHNTISGPVYLLAIPGQQIVKATVDDVIEFHVEKISDRFEISLTDETIGEGVQYGAASLPFKADIYHLLFRRAFQPGFYRLSCAFTL